MYQTIILPVVSCGCDTLRGEPRLRVLENWFLWLIFGPKRDEVTWQWRKIYSSEFLNLYLSPNIIRQIMLKRMMWAWHFLVLY
jgi:hypothetical protein